MIKFFRNIAFNIYTFFFHFFLGLRNADTIAFSQGSKGNDGNGGNIEVQDEEQSVYKDLLRGEVTQEVRELRHEMYYADRESKKYDYIGNGLAKKKKNELFDYKGKYESSDGLPLKIVLFNEEDTGGVVENLEMDDSVTKPVRRFRFSTERDYLPRFKVEEYASKLMVKELDNEHVIIDIYTTKYVSQFDRRHRIFLNELERVYQGDKRSDIVCFDKIKFTTYNSWGADDLKDFAYNNIVFEDILEFDGEYVLRFKADIEYEGIDSTSEFYDEIAAKKFEEKAPRDGKTADVNAFLSKIIDDKNYELEKDLINAFKEGKL